MVVRAQVRQIRKRSGPGSGCGGGDPEPGVGDTGRGDSGNRKEGVRGGGWGEGTGAQNGRRIIGEGGSQKLGRETQKI